MAFVMIIFFRGFLSGWDHQAKHDMIEWEIGESQFWQETYDPFDPFTLNESHAAIPAKYNQLIEDGEMTPVLITQGTIYPDGRMQSVLLKGISERNNVIALPTEMLNTDGEEVYAIIGSMMAQNSQLAEGDYVVLRWRDIHGTFDAVEIKIAGVFDCDVPSVDAGQIWIPLKQLQEMMGTPNEATILISAVDHAEEAHPEGWKFKSQHDLLSDIEELIKTKSIGGSIMYVILMLLAMLAIFDTQVLSIFRRQREIGTFVALGMTRGEVVRMFTVEGAMHAVLAMIVGAIYGIPLFWFMATKGIAFPAEATQDFGIALADVIYPVFSLMLIIGTSIIVLITTAIVSWIPARKISRMKPTDAIRGKLQ
jgi:ABC-type lipoprotein release transport system permease subunit